MSRRSVFVARTGNAFVYRVDGTARARFVRSARRVTDDREAPGRLMASDFDPDREILLHDAPEAEVRPVVGASASITSSREPST